MLSNKLQIIIKKSLSINISQIPKLKKKLLLSNKKKLPLTFR